MNINQIVDTIADGFDKSLDVMFKERLKFCVKYYRATFIKQEIDKGNYHDLFQHFIVVPLKKVDIVDDCAIEMGCDVLRSVNKIPQPVRNKGAKSFPFVGSVNGTVRFEQVSLENVRLKIASKYRQNRIYYDYRNEYLYVYNNLKLEFVGIKGVFADLDALREYQCNDGACYTDYDTFPLPIDMIQRIITGLLTNELRIVSRDDKEVDIDVEQNDRD
jgi:hypothetical protein